VVAVRHSAHGGVRRQLAQCLAGGASVPGCPPPPSPSPPGRSKREREREITHTKRPSVRRHCLTQLREPTGATIIPCPGKGPKAMQQHTRVTQFELWMDRKANRIQLTVFLSRPTELITQLTSDRTEVLCAVSWLVVVRPVGAAPERCVYSRPALPEAKRRADYTFFLYYCG
jgi:hypothetical protein